MFRVPDSINTLKMMLKYPVEGFIMLFFRMLQDHHCLQPCSDSSSVCRVLNCPVSANWGQSQAHRR